MDQARKLALLDQQIAEAGDLKPTPDDLRVWITKTEVVLRAVLGDASPLYASFKVIEFSIKAGGRTLWTTVPGIIEISDSEISQLLDSWGEVEVKGVGQGIAILTAAKTEVELLADVPIDVAGQLVPVVAPDGPIFVVHGRNDAMLHYVVRVIQDSTGRKPTVLREQPNAGRTILEKFEEHAAVAAYAVVLLTADDEGGLAGDTAHARARQNVIFELGFFFAQLGRKRVAVLVHQGVEKPSDIDGLVYIDLDSGGAWKHTLAKELAAVGISVDYARIP
jgi:predicted nucleotide-binding protein